MKQKKAAAEAVEDLAADLLELQAERESRPGISFNVDTEWQQEFDASFPYTETDDQLVSVDAIKIDMQKARPMDRLICGDVGFGKTELAMRAAFKAIDNGYQVACWCQRPSWPNSTFTPFSERMAEFPFTIAKLSRFCTSKEQRETVAGLGAGKRRYCDWYASPGLAGRQFQQSWTADHRRRATVRRRSQGTLEDAP